MTDPWTLLGWFLLFIGVCGYLAVGSALAAKHAAQCSLIVKYAVRLFWPIAIILGALAP